MWVSIADVAIPALTRIAGINEMVNKEKMPESFRDIIISVLPKVPDAYSTHLFRPGRDGRENILNIQTIIDYIEATDGEGAIFFLDMEKAFDRVSFDTVRDLFEIHRWPNRFVSLVKTVYAENKCRANKVFGYADDTVILAGNVRDTRIMLNKLERYETSTGGHVNIDKTKTILCGKAKRNNFRQEITTPITDFAIYLGVHSGILAQEMFCLPSRKSRCCKGNGSLSPLVPCISDANS
eukprot:TRINITY_DN1447_c1_g1_i18.p1 TRINITY_DN1447_c1_g1~~TRINITY_DN1447_c1_g1_i18.p1  ORF type:complete len:238 (-),score=29.20 TRINITY_DN1447_c1_g1_i18:396-1109(-)